MKQELPNYQTKIIRSFGRIKSRKLSTNKKNLLDNLLPKILLNKNSYHEINNLSQLNLEKNILEIGFGFGDFLFNLAKNNQDKKIYGFEPHLNGVVNLLAMLEHENLNNIMISCEDIRFEITNFSDNFFDEIYILFPDPWPKFKHFKRRLITSDFLENSLANKIKKAGKIIIATDHDDYKTWILSVILSSQKFYWNAENKSDWQKFPDNWIKTKYQKKAILEGRIPVIFELTKI
jgi:tRNA (guanine-N7-)-methyltransferase